MKNVISLPEASDQSGDKMVDVKSSERSRCARCKRAFIPRTTGQLYGPKCARIMAGQVQLDSMTLVSEKVLRKKTAPTNSGVMT